MDGTIYNENEIFDGTLEFLEEIRQRGPGGDELSASDPEGTDPDAGHDPAGMPDLSCICRRY